MEKKYRVTLTPEERADLERMTRTGKAAATKLTHARILLLADESPGGAARSDGQIMDALGVSKNTVCRVRERFVEQGFESALVRKPPARTYARKRIDFAAFVRELVDGRYKDAIKVVLVMDNLNTHSIASLYEAFAPAEARRIADKLEIHYTPRHGSWLNMAEIELSVLSRQCLDRRIADKATVVSEVGNWESVRNAAGSRIDWRFTTKDARIKLKRLYPIQA